MHRIDADGTIGDKVEQPNKLDTGIFAHQIRVTPDNKHVILITRGNNAPSDNPVDPGSIKTFAFKDGVLTNLAAIAPGDGMHFGPRHLDFHPKKPWVFVSIESQNQLAVYKLDDATGLSRDPLFVKNTLADANSKLRQAAGAIHVSPDGRFVYLANRAWWTTDFEGKKVFTGGENSIAVFSINQTTGEPTLIQNADGHGNYLRTFNLDPSGKFSSPPLYGQSPCARATTSRRCRRAWCFTAPAATAGSLSPQIRHRGFGAKAAVLGRHGDASVIRTGLSFAWCSA